MAYKINGTTVVDNSRNVCACCVTSCCITASTRLDAPSGTTANRPASPATGSIYFDTDEGSLVSYNGTEWSKIGGSTAVEYNNIATASNEAWAMGYVGSMGSYCRGCCSGYHHTAQCNVLTSFSGSSPFHICSACSSNEQCFCILATMGCYPATLNRDTWSLCCRCYPLPQTNNWITYCGCFAETASVFPDGSFCQSGVKCWQFYCSHLNTYHGIFINKLGGASYFHTSFNTTCICNCSYADTVPPLAPYCGTGLNSALPTLGTVCHYYDLYCPSFDCINEVHWNGVFSQCSQGLEMKTDCLGQAGWNSCCHTRRTFNPAQSMVSNMGGICDYDLFGGNCRVVPVGNYIVPQITSGMFVNSVNGRIFCNCCNCNCKRLTSFTFIAKNPNFDNNNPCWYDKQIACNSCTGLRSISALNHTLCCSVMISHDVSIPRGSCPSRNLTELASQNQSWSFISRNGNCLFHFYLPASCRNCMCGIFCCAACCIQCIYRHSDFCVPALIQVRLCDACITCSLFYCGMCDCTKGNTSFPYCAKAGQYLSQFHQGLSYYRGQHGYNSSVMTYSHNHKGRGFDHLQCIVDSCACSNWSYHKMNLCCAGGFIGVFNESTLNFDKFVLAYPYHQCCCAMDMNFIEMAYRGCCNTDARYQCICAKAIEYMCARGKCPAHDKGGFFQTLYGHCMILCAYENCAVPILVPFSYCNWCVCGGGTSNAPTSYINPCTDHLVCFAMILTCYPASGNTCANVRWLGALCFDLTSNDLCLTKVETLWPTPSDHAMYAKSKGLGCWCGSSNWCGGLSYVNCYACRPCNTNYPNQITNGYNCGFLPYIFRTYSNATGDEGGIVIKTRSRSFPFLDQISCCLHSSCARCSSCCTGHGDYGWFGADCHGADVCLNTCCNGCGAGLTNGRVHTVLSKIPYNTPLSCSKLFECVCGDKELIEYFLGCNCLYIWTKAIHCFSCNYSCADAYLTCLRMEKFILPGFDCKQDITCNHTLNCCCYPWGMTQFTCPACRLMVFDTNTVNVCVCTCASTVWYNWTGNAGCCFCCCCCGYCCNAPLKCHFNLDWQNNSHRYICIYGADCHCIRQACCYKPCNIENYQLIMYDNITDCIFNNLSPNSEFFQPGEYNIKAVQYNCYPYAYSNCNPIKKIDYDEYGFASYTANTDRGINGLLMQWFNCAYSCYCNY